ncbi:NUDIX hydrolase [Solicola gregarius]|uniref:NUDIX domain-containing protein n=1 Tax=Solicola gregarius TaxID=2908642 RepID=A0AA46YLY4_9ACTN|nr:NUDIX domain-containing protein [Solicola gregarius]UYM06089.1 NUDIX domain-containing protein [Solicola gregarius]
MSGDDGGLHADAVDLLGRWRPPGDDQDRLRAAYLTHLAAHPDAMRRSCTPDHLTASVLVMSAERTHVLLTLHRKLAMWLQTGGHCEPSDAGLVAAATREGVEESGIADLSTDPDPVLLSRHEVPCGPVRPAHHLDVQFVAYAPPGAQARISEESADLRWFPLGALPESADASVRALVGHAARR